MVFCAYCGKSFTRKEHLERHIPSHTNVKPHRCSLCQLSFSRRCIKTFITILLRALLLTRTSRDLLQRHHSTYHEVKDPTQPQSANPPTIAGRTPIACINCANAKAGCDKVVPCTRCTDKNLPCAARFARRATKASHRAPDAQETARQRAGDVSKGDEGSQCPVISSSEHKPTQEPLQDAPTQSDVGKALCFPTDVNEFDVENLDAPISGMYDMFGGLSYNGEMVSPVFQFQDLLDYNDYSMNMDIFDAHLAQPRLEVAAPADPGEISSGSSVRTSSVHENSMPQTRGTSITSRSDTQMDIDFQPDEKSKYSAPAKEPRIYDVEAMIAAESAWPLARCNPPTYSGSCPRTAILHLEGLEGSSKNDDSWSSLNTVVSEINSFHNNQPLIEPMATGTRDKMLAITQSFLHKALRIHRGGRRKSRATSPDHASSMGTKFLVLPPSSILEYFLQEYARSLTTYYALEAGGRIDPNELMLNTQASTLLVLLMIAQGASTIPMTDTRALAAGLTETCRISLFDIIEKDVELSADSTVLRCALLFTILGAWSGDKWHMDMIMGQRGMYLAMLKHSGALESQYSVLPTDLNFSSPELQWQAWLQLESRNRLVYNWVLVDQELSLFHDAAPILSIADIETRLPDSERLWAARDGREWLSILRDTRRTSAGTSMISQLPMSLCGLFQELLVNNLTDRHCQLTPLKMRLLLHPLQAMVSHLRQILSCFSEDLGPRRGTMRVITKDSTMGRLEEVQTLLRQWYDAAGPFHHADSRCLISHISLILYHLISLNVVSCFPEIERLARKDGFDGSHWELSLRHKRCIQQSTEALFHAGQVIRLVKMMPLDDRPQWWPVAIYRATMILWVDRLAKTDPNFPQQPASGPTVLIDDSPPADPILAQWMWTGEGIPVLKRADGRLTKLHVPGVILDHCIALLEEGPGARMTDGIIRRLRILHGRWHDMMDSFETR
ncbi:MAG: hypothetical protein M1818_006978 [Claussenomyces sp. TS43310]|nr:MAG: hypothetical protein M1818_006978 [Claussenomyces sp. TS43310]